MFFWILVALSAICALVGLSSLLVAMGWWRWAAGSASCLASGLVRTQPKAQASDELYRMMSR